MSGSGERRCLAHMLSCWRVRLRCNVLLGLLNEGAALTAMSEAELEAFIEAFSKGSGHFPPLPPGFSRAAIYTDHD